MAWSAKEIRKKKYLPFPGHNDKVSKAYHSEKLPNPNVIRIEVLSPSAKAAYLNGGFYAMTNRFQHALMDSMLYDDATKPFYGFFDPTKDAQGITFGINASWTRGKHGFGEATGMLKRVTGAVSKIPVIGDVGKVAGGLVGAAQKVGEYSQKMANAAGLNTNSTGACTLKDFERAEFTFNKKVECKWYMPEQENMARLSISRLLTLAFVRSANVDDADLVGKLTSAVSELTSSQEWQDTMSAVSEFTSEVTGTVKKAGSAVGDAVGGAVRDIPYVGDFIVDTGSEAAKFWGDTAGQVKDALTPDADTMNLAADVMKMAANEGLNFMLKVNSFFGGNITVNPFPVRLTMGHILDIEPVVIKSVEFHSSKEQFISEDGTHIPLYITADIQFEMWMTPDPKKGFIRWMGDDVFNSGRYLKSSKSDGKAGTSGSTGGGKKKVARKRSR